MIYNKFFEKNQGRKEDKIAQGRNTEQQKSSSRTNIMPAGQGNLTGKEYQQDVNQKADSSYQLRLGQMIYEES